MGGVRFYDLIFPLFVFIVGVSLVFSLTKALEQQGTKAAIKRIFVRTLLLFVLGIIYSGGISRGIEGIGCWACCNESRSVIFSRRSCFACSARAD